MKIVKHWKLKQIIYKSISRIVATLLGAVAVCMGYFFIYRADDIIDYKNKLYTTFFNKNFEINLDEKKYQLTDKTELKEFIIEEFNNNVYIDLIRLKKKILDKFIFINNVHVKKKFPNIYNVSVKEYKVTGLLQKGEDKYYVLDTEEFIRFKKYKKIDADKLVKYYGEGALENLNFIHGRINTFNENNKDSPITIAIFILQRRWDIEISGVKVRFPNGDFADTWDKFLTVWRDISLKKKIRTLDFRVAGKLFIGK